MARQDDFAHFEPNQSLGGAKTEDPREKRSLSHTWPELGLNPQQWDDERFRLLKSSVLNHLATGQVALD